MDVLLQIVEEYANAGAYTDAAGIWQLIGNLAATETTSFRERYGLTPSTYGNRLAELLELSRSNLRAALVRNMVAFMHQSVGRYL
jgi:hypothetical protein